MKNILLILFILLSVAAKAQDPNLHIYLCFGQSNMEGAGTIESQDRSGVNSRFQVMGTVNCNGSKNYTLGQWTTSSPPLVRCNTGLGPSDYFGRTMVANLPANVKIGVVPVAIGGCDIALFDKVNYGSYVATAPSWMQGTISAYGGNPYARLVEMAKLAQRSGVIKGILLHQGETNNTQASWPGKVKAIYDNLIRDLGLNASQTPLLVGELVTTAQGGACGAHNAIIATVPNVIPNAHVISAAGLPHVGDKLHFTSASYRTLGQRYAQKMISLLSVNISPTVNLTAPAANASFTAPAIINITANAADVDGTVSSVAFYNGSTLLGTDATAPYSYSWTNVAVGTYSITARATDNSGATTTSTAVSVTVTGSTPNTPPTVSLTAPAANASFTAPSTISITANASDANGTVSSVAFYNGTTLLGTDATAPYSYSWTNVAVGTYSITARATDNAGATTTSTAVSVIVTVTTPNTPPTVSLTAPAANASFTAPATISITANASDANGTVSSVAFYNGTTLLGTDATAPYSYSWTNVAVGTYSITARATDNAGATTTSTAVSVTVTGPTSTDPIVGPGCGSNNATLSLSLNSANRANVTSYNWWYTGSAASTTAVSGAPYSVTIQTGANFSTGQVCVGTNLSVSPWYVQYCKTITKCAGARLGVDEFGVETLTSTVIQPNPSLDNFYLTAAGDISKIIVLNETGKEVCRYGSIEKGTTITIGNELAGGIYMVTIQYLDGTNEIKRIVKSK